MTAPRWKLIHGSDRRRVCLPPQQNCIVMFSNGRQIHSWRCDQLTPALVLRQVGKEGDGHAAVWQIINLAGSAHAECLVTSTDCRLKTRTVLPNIILQSHSLVLGNPNCLRLSSRN